MDWRELIRNKWFLGAAGVAGVAGVVVLLRRRGSGTSSADTSSSDSPYSSGAVGGFSSAPTDFAAILGQYQETTANQFREFEARIEDRLAQMPSDGSGTGTAPPPVRRPVVPKTPPQKPGGRVLQTAAPLPSAV